MNWREKANETYRKIICYSKDTDGWKVAKKSKDVTVWYKQAPDWNGTLYKTEAQIHASPEAVYSYVDPNPDGPRSKWDKAVKELAFVDDIEPDLKVVRTITHSAIGGLISSRDFVDLVISVKNEELLATCGAAVEHEKMPASSDHVRGTNYPCAILCYKVQGEPDQTKLMSFTQTSLGGMLPKQLVENVLPSNQVDMMATLKKALQEGGHWKGPAE